MKTHKVRMVGTASNGTDVDVTFNIDYTEEQAQEVAKNLNYLFNAWGADYDNLKAEAITKTVLKLSGDMVEIDTSKQGEVD